MELLLKIGPLTAVRWTHSTSAQRSRLGVRAELDVIAGARHVAYFCRIALPVAHRYTSYQVIKRQSLRDIGSPV